MDLSKPQGSSERGVSSPHSRFTTILNLPITSLPSYLPPSSSLLTPPAVSPGNRLLVSDHLCPSSKAAKKDDSSSFVGHSKTSTSVARTGAIVDSASTTTSGAPRRRLNLVDAPQQSGYLDLLKSLISEESLDPSKSFRRQRDAASGASVPVPPLWPPTGANLHDDSSLFAPLRLPAAVPLLPSQRFDPTQLLLASANHSSPPAKREVESATPSPHRTAAADMMIPKGRGVTDAAASNGCDTKAPRSKELAGSPHNSSLLSTIHSSLTMKEEDSCIPNAGLLPNPKLRDDLNVVVPEETAAPPSASEEEGIDVCNFKEPFLLKKVVPHSDHLLHDGHKGSLTDEESEQEPDPPLATFSHLGSECARTVPSLMKFYSRHKRSLSSSLSVSLSVSGQATPPSSPISPGTLPRPSFSSRDKTPTPKTEESRPDSTANAASSSEAKHASPLAALTLLTIPKVAPPRGVASSCASSSSGERSPKKRPLSCHAEDSVPPYNSQYAESNCIRNKSQSNPQSLLRTCPDEHPRSGNVIPPSSLASTTSSSLQSSTSVPSLLPPITSSGGVMQGAMTLSPFATPWPLSHNPCPPPTGIPPPFWIPQGVDANVAARIGLGYQLATDPLTGHLLLVPRAHPLPDPGGHGLVWAGFGTPQVVMTPQQLLLGDAHFRHPLHAPHSLLHVPHPQPASVHSPAKKDTSSPSPITKEDVKKAPSNALEGATPSTDFSLPPGIPPSNLPPHFIYPPTSLPYFFSQPSHPSPYHLASFNHCSTTLSLSNNLISSLGTQITSSTTTLTTTKSLTTAVVSTTFSKTHDPVAPTVSSWSGSSNKATSPLNFYQSPSCNSFENKDLYSEPPIDLTRRPKSPSKENLPLSSSKPPPHNQFLGPLSVCTNPNLQGYNISKQTTTTFIIKKEIKEEVLSPNCLMNDESSANDQPSMSSSNHPLVKEESDSLRSIKNRCSCKTQVKDKALQVSSDAEETNFESKGLVGATPVVPYSKEQQPDHDSHSPPMKNSSVGTSPPLPRSPSVGLDISGLELLSHSILEHANRMQSPVSLKHSTDSDIETCSTHSDAMPLLEPAIYTPSPRSSPTFDNLPPVLSPPVPLPSLVSSSPKKENDPPSLEFLETTTQLPSSCKGLHGLSLLCALAEQRIKEEEQKCCSALSSLAEVASTQTEETPYQEVSFASLEANGDFRDGGSICPCNPPSPGPSTQEPQSHSDASEEATFSKENSESPEVDINRNYKSPQSHHEVIHPSKAALCPQSDQEEILVKASPQRIECFTPTDPELRNELAMQEEKHKDTHDSLSLLPSNESPLLTPVSQLDRSPQNNLRVEQPTDGGDSWMSDKDSSKDESLGNPPLLLKKMTESPHPEELDAIIREDSKPLPLPRGVEDEQTDQGNPPTCEDSLVIKTEEDLISSLSPADEGICSSSFKLPSCSSDLKQEESEDEHSKEPLSNDVSDRESKCSIAETSVESSPSDVELPSTLISSSKKRKPGRPKKHSPTKEDSTETIVAKKSRSMGFLLLSRSHKSKMKPKLKAELKVRDSDEDDSTMRENHKPNYDTELGDEKKTILPQRVPSGQPSALKCKKLALRRRAATTLHRGRSSLTRRAMLRDKEKRKSAIEKQSHLKALYRSLKEISTMAAAEHDESEDEKDDEEECRAEGPAIKQEAESASPSHEGAEGQRGGARAPLMTNGILHEEEEKEEKKVGEDPPDGASSLETTAQPGSESRPEEPVEIKEEPCASADDDAASTSSTPLQIEENSVCKLQIQDLIPHARVLILQDGLFYPGSLSPITPPDVYDVHVDGERSTKLHIYCQEDLLTQAWKEVKPGSTRFLTEGTRVCAFWSQQYRGLYPGTVAAASSPSQEGNHNLVNVEFDDGDSGRIHVDDVRLLPQKFPVVEYDPNPLLTLNKRKRRPTEETLETDTKPTTVGEPSSKKPKKPRKAAKETGEDVTFLESNANAVVSSEDEDDDDDDSLPAKKNAAKKRHKKRRHSDHHKHKHKHKHKRKRKHQRPLPHVEPVDGGELRFRIKSPPPLSEDKLTSFEAELDKQQAATSSEEEQEPQAQEEEKEKSAKAKQAKPGRRKRRKTSEKSKIAPFLLERRLWRWSGKGFKRPGAKGKGKKEFFKEIVRGKENIRVGDCAVFLSTGQPDRPYIGRIESLWESWGGNMVVKVKWFYHPEETKGLGKRLAEPKGALFQSPHTDENDVQTISHKCDVIPRSDYKLRRAELERVNGPEYENYDLYYLAGFYDPIYGRITMEPGVS